MPRNLFEDVVFTIVMASVMVYGMIVYNVSLNTGSLDPVCFVAPLSELPIMVPVAFCLEMFMVGKLAKGIVFSLLHMERHPRYITVAISICICLIMCPLMSLVAMLLFKEVHSFSMWLRIWITNLPMALILQLCFVGPLVRKGLRAFQSIKRPDNMVGMDV